MPQRGVQMGQDWNTVSFGTRPQSAASSHQKQQTLRDAQRTGGQIETTAKHGGGKNGGLSAAAVEANRLDADTGEGSASASAVSRVNPSTSTALAAALSSG